MSDSTAGRTGSERASGGPAPTTFRFTRNATGLVREVSLFQQLAYNAAATNPLGLGLVSFPIALVIFPRANPYIALVVTALMCLFVWTAFALLTAAIPRVGGDYTINTRILSPTVALGANLAAALSALSGAVLVAWGTGTLGLSPALTVIGAVTGSDRFTTWGDDLSTTHHTVNLIVTLLVLAVLTALSIVGTRVVVRAMTWLFVVAIAGLVVSVVVALFTSHGDFVGTVNSTFGPGTYAKTVKAGEGAGLYPGSGGYSTKATIGACYSALVVLIYVFWGTYMSAEFRGAGQRRRQLIAMNGTGVFCMVSLVALIALYTHVIGYDFFVSSLGGNFSGAGSGAIGSAGYVYFSSLMANNDILVVLIALTFVAWYLPAVFINLSMPQRAIMTWALDGLLPRRLGAVNDRTHTPVAAILICFAITVPIAVFLSYSSNFIALLGVTTLFSFFSIVMVGISAAVVRWRRPDIYRGSAAEWRLGGVEVLPLAGVGCAIVGLIGCGIILHFHESLGIKYFHGMEIASVVVLLSGAVWWTAARAVRRGQGVDLAASYQAIPPE